MSRGKMKNNNLIYDPKTHTYYIEGRKIPSVTHILGAENFYADLHRISSAVLAAAAKFGRAGHKACELLDKNTLDFNTLSEHLFPYVTHWLDYKVDNQIEKINAIEMPVYSKKWGYAGTLDRVVNDNILIDIKFSSVISPTTALQLALYKVAYEEMTGNKIKERLCVQLTQDGYKVYTYKDKMDEYIALGAVNSFKWKMKNGIYKEENNEPE
jgi:hypothetical protein